MRTIAITKKCAEYEKNLILSSVEKENYGDILREFETG